MHNLILKEKLEQEESKFKTPEIIDKYIPKRLRDKTSKILDFIIRMKRKAKIKTKVNEVVSKVYCVDPEYLKEQEEQIRLNKERREKKYNKEKHPKSYYNDCYSNSKEYKKNIN